LLRAVIGIVCTRIFIFIFIYIITAAAAAAGLEEGGGVELMLVVYK